MKIYFLISVFFLAFKSAMAFADISTEDTTAQNKIYLNIDIGGGMIYNSTVGLRPMLFATCGIRSSKNYIYGSIERRFGKSANEYEVSFKDSLIKSTAYNTVFAGIEYERFFKAKPKSQFSGIIGIGADNIKLDKDKFDTDKKLSAFCFNVGFGYSYYFNGKHGPSFKVLYHHGKFTGNKNNDNLAANINAHSIIIRLGYNFSRFYKASHTN